MKRFCAALLAIMFVAVLSPRQIHADLVDSIYLSSTDSESGIEGENEGRIEGENGIKTWIEVFGAADQLDSFETNIDAGKISVIAIPEPSPFLALAGWITWLTTRRRRDVLPV